MKHLKKIHHLSTLFAVWSSLLGAIGISIIIFDEAFRLNIFPEFLEDASMFLAAIFIIVFCLCAIVSVLLSLYRLAIK